jgi:hypothetical protein
MGRRVPMSASIQDAARGAIQLVIEPLARLALDAELGVGDFVRTVERAFVLAVERAAAETNRPRPSDTEISIRTGLTRVKVNQIRASEESARPNATSGQPRAIRILWGWRHDPDFLDRTGKPRLLPLRGRRSFVELIKRHAGDPRVRSILMELKRLQTVKQHADGQVELIDRSNSAVPWVAADIRLLGESAREQLETLLYNLPHPSMPRFHRRVVNVRVKTADASRLVRDASRQTDSLAETIEAAIVDRHVTVEPRDCAQAATLLSVTFFMYERDVVAEPITAMSDRGGHRSRLAGKASDELKNKKTVDRREKR